MPVHDGPILVRMSRSPSENDKVDCKAQHHRSKEEHNDVDCEGRGRKHYRSW